MPRATGTDHHFLNDERPSLLSEADAEMRHAARLSTLDWRQAIGGGFLLMGLLARVLGWWGVSGTLSTADQLSYLLSGGLAGAALIATGLTLLVSYEHAADRVAIGYLGEQLALLEDRLAGEFDAVHERFDQPNGKAPRQRSGAVMVSQRP
jgi:hypothetical protein